MMSSVWMAVTSWSFTKSAPTSSSEAKAMTLRKMVEAVWSDLDCLRDSYGILAWYRLLWIDWR